MGKTYKKVKLDALDAATDFKVRNYYRDKETGRVYSIRPVDKANVVAVQCFCHKGQPCEIVELGKLANRNMEHFATNFPAAFNRYWRENRTRLMRQNKAEMKGLKLPYNMLLL